MPVISCHYYAFHLTEGRYGLLQRALWQKCGVHKNSRVKSSPLVHVCSNAFHDAVHRTTCSSAVTKNVSLIIQLLCGNFCKIASVFTQADVPNASVDPARGSDLSLQIFCASTASARPSANKNKNKNENKSYLAASTFWTFKTLLTL